MATRKVNVTRLGVGSTAKVVGVGYALIGLVLGLIATVGVAAGAITSDSSFVQSLGVSLVAFGWGVILYPAVLFVVGWLEGAVLALVLNIVFAESKGLELTLEDV